MQTAVLTFDGFNEIDSFVALAMLSRLRKSGWAAHITSPDATVTSMNGVVVHRQRPLAFAAEADAVVIGSGARTREWAADPALLAQLRLDPARQLIAAQCSGALILHRLGHLQGMAACTDVTTRPWLVEAGADVVDAPFLARGNVATAGGCLASHYLAGWLIARGPGLAAAEEAIRYVAPVGQQDEWAACALAAIGPGLADVRPEAA